MDMHGWRLISLIAAGLLGGYAFASAAGVFLGGVLTGSRSEAAMTGHLLGFVVYAAAIVWVAHTRRPGLAWLVFVTGAITLTLAGQALVAQS
ncbi:MAG: hypothetical protein WD071_15675 [Pseudohongiella sp.]|uniref:hypothetical protein n=1 Tax=Pseudohongiella sp. TaxID=1979412 RepID=UPI00349FD6A6